MFRRECIPEVHRIIQSPNGTAVLLRDLPALLNIIFFPYTIKQVVDVLSSLLDFAGSRIYVAVRV